MKKREEKKKFNIITKTLLHELGDIYEWHLHKILITLVLLSVNGPTCTGVRPKRSFFSFHPENDLYLWYIMI